MSMRGAKHQRRRPAGKNRDGFVLIAVIWLAGLIAAVAAGFAVTVRSDILASANIARNAEAEAAADGMARLLAFQLATTQAAAVEARRDGTLSACRWNDRIVVGAAIQDQGGLVDLNAAPADLLERLIAGLGAPSPRADALAAAIADFRDVDREAKEGVFEPDRYDGASFGPKNAPFEAVEELDQLPGMDEALYRRLLPLVTVHSAQPGFDPAVAPAGLKQALGLGATLPPEIAALSLASAGQTFGLDVMAVSASGARYRRLAIVSLVRQPERPYAILSWQRGGDFELTGKAARPCFN